MDCGKSNVESGGPVRRFAIFQMANTKILGNKDLSESGTVLLKLFNNQ